MKLFLKVTAQRINNSKSWSTLLKRSLWLSHSVVDRPLLEDATIGYTPDVHHAFVSRSWGTNILFSTRFSLIFSITGRLRMENLFRAPPFSFSLIEIEELMQISDEYSQNNIPGFSAPWRKTEETEDTLSQEELLSLIQNPFSIGMIEILN